MGLKSFARRGLAGVAPALQVFDVAKAATHATMNGARALRDSDIHGRQLARDNRDYTANREDTAVQRRAADLKAAGINPILAGNPGQAADSASPQQPVSHVGDALGAATSALSLANPMSKISGLMNVAKQVAEIKNIQAQTGQTQVQTANTAFLQPYTAAQMLAQTGAHDASSAKALGELNNLPAQYRLWLAQAYNQNTSGKATEIQLPAFAAEAQARTKNPHGSRTSKELRGVGGLALDVLRGVTNNNPVVNNAKSLGERVSKGTDKIAPYVLGKKLYKKTKGKKLW